MRILAIETSCDETAASIVEERRGQVIVNTNVVFSQIATHAATGGVVPNIAARLHSQNLPEVLIQATKNKKISFQAVAVTTGPGLIGCLLIGLSAAQTIVALEKKPIYGINHLEGHIYSAWLGEEAPELPALVVIVSGGHTELVLMKRHLHYQLLGSTRDDAAGEAFDKVARLLELSYPGGPAISRLAVHGNPEAYQLPISLPRKGDLDFSFSGLKAATSFLLTKLPQPLPEHLKADVAASFQSTIAQAIVRKTQFALEKYPEVQSVCLVGGVSANSHLRAQLEQMINQEGKRRFFVPKMDYCTDNAAMIGAAAVYHYLFSKPDNWYDLEADPNRQLTSNGK